MAVVHALDFRQLRAYLWAIHTAASEIWVSVVARMWVYVLRLHAMLVFVSRLGEEIDLERASAKTSSRQESVWNWE